MFYLTIDVSSHIVVGVVQADERDMSSSVVVEQAKSDDARHHVELLSPMIHQVLSDAGIQRPDAIVVGTGPAAFTGLRSGLVTARTLAYSWDIPLYGLSSAEILALAGVDAGANIVESMIDARRHEVYALRARAMGPDDVDILEPVRVLSPRVLATELSSQPAIIACAQPDLYADILPERVVIDAEPSVMVRLLFSRMARRDAGEHIVFDTEPQYLRRPDVHSGAHAQPAAQGNPYGK